MKNLKGVVLSGGKSTRMGSDKGLLPINGTNWATHMLTLFEALKMPAILSINPDQYKQYRAIFPPEKLQMDKDLPIAGPLKGLLSVHLRFPDDDLFLIACDMIDMEKELMQNLIDLYNEDDKHNFFVYQHENFIEPFCGIYTSLGLKKVMDQVKNNKLKDFSLQNVLATISTKRVSIGSTTAFKNYNYGSDL